MQPRRRRRVASIFKVGRERARVADDDIGAAYELCAAFDESAALADGDDFDALARSLLRACVGVRRAATRGGAEPIGEQSGPISRRARPIGGASTPPIGHARSPIGQETNQGCGSLIDGDGSAPHRSATPYHRSVG